MQKQPITPKDIINNYGATFAFIVAIVFFSFVSRGFFSGQNLQNILVQSTSLGICAFGLTFVLIAGEIDLSYGGVIGLVGAVLAGMLKEGHSIGMVTLVCLAIGLGTGLLNAILIVVLNLPSFLASVAVMFICMGAERIYNQGITTWIRDPEVVSIVQSQVGPVPAGVLSLYLICHLLVFADTNTGWAIHTGLGREYQRCHGGRGSG